MCGIAAYSGKVPFDPLKMKMLLYFNETRGEHSCGYYNEEENIPFGESRIKKSLGKVSETLLLRNIVPTKTFIGHTRKSTSPSTTNNIEYAHPFIFEDLIGVHNGSFVNWDYIAERYLKEDELSKGDLGLDSRLLLYWFQKRNNHDIMKYINGGTASIYTRKSEPGKIVCLRNDISKEATSVSQPSRPLYRGKIKDEKGKTAGMYISSIKESLEVIECVDIKEFKSNRVYEVFEGEIIGNGKKLPNYEGYSYQEHNAWKTEINAEKRRKEQETKQKEVLKALPEGTAKNSRLDISDLEPVKGTHRTVSATHIKIDTKKNAFKHTYYSDGTEDCINLQYFDEREVVWEEKFYDRIEKHHILVQFLSCGGFRQYRLESAPVNDNQSNLVVSDEDSIEVPERIYDVVNKTYGIITDNLHNIRESIRLHGLDDLREPIDAIGDANIALWDIYYDGGNPTDI